MTDAEWRVAEAVARGLSNKEIAAQLKLSLRIIEGHISRILDKKNLSNRVDWLCTSENDDNQSNLITIRSVISHIPLHV